jgi:Caspase domain
MANAAIIIGIDKYGMPEHCLDNCVTDALAFASWAVSPKGGDVDPQWLTLLLSPMPNSSCSSGTVAIPKTSLNHPYQAATRDNIVIAVDTLRILQQPLDRLYFYFSGHGSSAPGMIRASRVEPVLIPADFRNIRINNNLLIGFHEILDPLMDAGPQTQFYFFDACRDFALEEFERIPGQTVGRYLGSTPAGETVRRAQLLLYATAPGQKSAALGKGIFGGVLMEALVGCPGAVEWNGDEFDLTFSTLAAYVRNKVVDTVNRTFPDKGRAFVQIPEQDPQSGDPSTVIRNFTREEIGSLPLKVRVGPSEARPEGSVVVSCRTPVQDFECGRKAAPLELQSRFDLSPGYYSVRIGSPSFTEERRKIKLVAPHAEDVELRPLPVTLSPAAQNRWIQVQSPDPRLPVVVTGPMAQVGLAETAEPDRRKRQTWHAVGSVRIDDPLPGIYSAQIELPDASGIVRLIDYPTENGVIQFNVPPAQIGEAQMGRLTELNIASSRDAQVLPSELIGPVSDARLASILGFAAYAAYCSPEGRMKKLRSMGVTPIDASGGESWITVLLAAEAGHPAGMSPENLIVESRVSVVTLGEDPVYQNGTFKPLSGFSLAGEFYCSAPAGSKALELRLPGFVDTRFALVSLKGRVSVVVIVVGDDGAIEVQQYLFALLPEPGMPSLDPISLRDVDLTQRYYASGERFPDPLLDQLLMQKVLDPLMACTAGYELVRRGRGGEYLGYPDDSPSNVYGTSAMRNMLKFFDGIPDSHILAGLVDPENKVEHFRKAVATGVPLFVEGFVALQSFYKGSPLPQPLGAIAHAMIASRQWTSWIAREPMLSIQDGRFETPPPIWSSLEQSRKQIESVFSGVGGVEWMDVALGRYIVGGTAFLISPNKLLTSMNTVTHIGEKQGDMWRLRLDYPSYFNAAEDPELSPDSRIEIIGIETFDERLAMLTLAHTATSAVCIVAAQDTVLKMWESVYLVGYPAYNWRSETEDLTRSVGGKLRVKRLQPGVLLSTPSGKNKFDHSCFTLGGSGGSPVIKLLTGEVVGVHWGGWKKSHSRGRASAIYNLSRIHQLISAV